MVENENLLTKPISLSEDTEAIGIELRPRLRSFQASPFRVPPAKWTVAVLSLKPETFTFRVYILYMDRKIMEGREFGRGQEHELVDFIKKHPILNDRLLYCKGIG